MLVFEHILEYIRERTMVGRLVYVQKGGGIRAASQYIILILYFNFMIL